jgi:hypothetical protein
MLINHHCVLQCLVFSFLNGFQFCHHQGTDQKVYHVSQKKAHKESQFQNIKIASLKKRKKRCGSARKRCGSARKIWKKQAPKIY